MNKVNPYNPYRYTQVNDNLQEDGCGFDFSNWYPYKTEDTKPVIGEMSEGVREFVEGRSVDSETRSIFQAIIDTLHDEIEIANLNPYVFYDDKRTPPPSSRKIIDEIELYSKLLPK